MVYFFLCFVRYASFQDKFVPKRPKHGTEAMNGHSHHNISPTSLKIGPMQLELATRGESESSRGPSSSSPMSGVEGLLSHGIHSWLQENPYLILLTEVLNELLPVLTKVQTAALPASVPPGPNLQPLSKIADMFIRLCLAQWADSSLLVRYSSVTRDPPSPTYTRTPSDMPRSNRAFSAAAAGEIRRCAVSHFIG